VLCQHPQISSGSILLLAPTGKARVRMEEVARKAGTGNFQARTLAQHLSSSGRYDGEVQRYLLNNEPAEKVARTVIVDECSMLTEDMLAALLQSLAGVHRLIFVGDPRQLPPIGAGRPFVDIVSHLTPENIESIFPRVAKGFAELTIPRRQGAGERDDLQLASWFGGGMSGPGDDQVFEILAGKRKSDTIRFIRWETPDELERAIPEVLAEHLGFDSSIDEPKAFARATGAVLDDKGNAWFNAQWGDRAGSGKAADAWQILTPVRQKAWGVELLNRLIHLHYKGQQVEWAKRQKPWDRKIPPPMGEQQIIYGDKVINNRNWSVPKGRMFPKPAERGYLANGEIGVVVGHRRTKKRDWKPENLEIEFSSQLGTNFTYYPSDFGEEGDAALELAYALTIHKAQGSEFEIVFLVLPRSPLMLSRELLYTALTRQRRKVVVLHQGDATELQRLSAEYHSLTATRLTNLFRAPKPVQVRGLKDRFLEERLIHITTRGDAVRSKSEVIIANMLHAKGINYLYEEALKLDGVTKYPDFTIEDDNTGITYYWEHCGMLHDPGYRSRWEEKNRWYAEQGITEQGGTNGKLIVTRDQANGGFDASAVAAIIERLS
jgi:ATP-dependent exoDNAse (exonuclease V) alpha subunit